MYGPDMQLPEDHLDSYEREEIPTGIPEPADHANVLAM